MTAVLGAEGLVFESGGKRILDGVSLRLEPGKVLAVIGPNGAGKSSLLNLLSGWWKPDAGTVRLAGRAVSSFAPAERARLCAVMRQVDSRPAGICVQEAVELGRFAVGGDAAAVAEEMLRRMDLLEIAGRDCANLSGGEWQRASFARAAAQVFGSVTPAALLLDEPVSSLDPAHQHQLLAEARRIAADGHAVLAVLHDLNLTAMYADEVLALKVGRVAGFGPAAELMDPAKLSEIYSCRVERLHRDGITALVSLP
jgi:iron complex transport system ATP-binding protein